MRLKEIAKRWLILYWINAKLKCYALKKERSRLINEYERKAKINGFSYEEKKAVDVFRRNHRGYCPNFVPPLPGALRVFWIGADRSQDESGFLQALERLCKVTIFYNVEGSYGLWPGNPSDKEASSLASIRKANDDQMLLQIEQAIALQGVDLLIGQMWAGLISKEALSKVHEMGIPIINISMDDRLPGNWSIKDNIKMGSVGLGPSLDMVLTTSPESCIWYGVEGYPSIFWPLASDPGVYSPSTSSKRDIDVLFIGNKYGVRGQIVNYLQNNGVKVDCYGRGWPNGYANSEQMASLSKRAKIILGVGTVGHCQNVYTLKLRDFDAPMSGAMYLTHRNPDLCQLYAEGKEIECYEYPKEALNKIRFYLEHPIDLARIAKCGHEKALDRDTWDKRLLTTFQHLGLLQANTVAITKL